MQKALTNKTLEALKPQAKRYEVHDLLCPGMSVRVSARGQKVFSVKFRYGLDQKRVKLGVFPRITLATAREKAMDILRQVDEGIDPTKRRRVTDMKVEVICREFIRLHAQPRNKSWREAERILEREFVGSFGQRDIREIKRFDVVELMDGAIARGSAYQANRILSHGRAAVRVGAAAGASTALQEGVLQGTQETRTAEESAINIGASVVLGGLLGGGVSLLTRGEHKTAAAALHNIVTAQPGSVGAAAVEHATLADLTVAGTAAERLAGATKAISPNLRANFRESAAAREASQQLAENTLYQTMHGEGRSASTRRPATSAACGTGRRSRRESRSSRISWPGTTATESPKNIRAASTP